MSIKDQALQFADELWRQYWVERDAHRLAELLEADILWNRLDQSTVRGAQELIAYITQNETLRDQYALLDGCYQAVALSDTVCMIESCMKMQHKQTSQKEQLHAVLGITLRNGRMRLKYLRFNPLPGHVEQPGLKNAEQLRRLVEEKTREIQEREQDLRTLTENIPGGIFRCLYDEKLTIMQMSDSFLSLLGFDREEIASRFHNSFLEMIDPRDRARSLEDCRRQLAKGNAKELEYRVICKDGRRLWVLDKGQLIKTPSGQPSFYCILVDMTKGKEAQEELRMTLGRYQIVMDQTNDIIFEWDVRADTMIYSANWQKKFGYAPVSTMHTLSRLRESGSVHADDHPALWKMVEDLLSGAPYAEGELRIKRSDGAYLWCRVRATAQQDAEKQPLRVVGVIVDIDSEKRQSQALLEQAQRDALTKLYNRGTAQSLVESQLQSDPESCALFIIDVDNFKQVNDTMGHLFGDAFLMEISNQIQKLFRSRDVVGRIGGDEFMVLMRDIPDTQVAERKANQVIEVFHALTTPEKIEVSCSVGIAFFPQDGQQFQELYKKADRALYEAKRQGKNRYIVYSGEEMAMPNGMSEGVYSAISARIDSDDTVKVLTSKLVEYVFRILYKSIDIQAAVQSILEIVGRHFDVSRAYIFENTEDDQYCCNTFEWCNEGVKPEIDNLRYVSYAQDIGEDYFDNFDADGIFYCRDVRDLPERQYRILEPQGIKSMLQCAIRDGGKIRGYVGFDECRINRFWTQEQIMALTFISEILSTFLLKQRAQDRASQTARNLQAVLDNQNSWVYVIDPATYALSYINLKTQKLVPSVREGMRCHEAFFHRDQPCEQCPARDIRSVKNRTLEIYNPVLKVWTIADACLIPWKDGEACLLCCHDITKYREILEREHSAR